MPLTVGDIVEVSVYADHLEQAAVNILWYRITGHTGAGPTEQELATALAAYAKPFYRAVMGSAARYAGVAMRVATTLPLGGYWYAKNEGAGLSGANLMPRQVAGLVSWRTATGGRHGRGRSYIPFPSEEDNAAAAVQMAGYNTSLAALAAAMRTTGAMVYSGADTATLVLQIRRRSNHTFIPVTHYVTSAKWATQRRRGSFGRPNKVPDALAS